MISFSRTFSKGFTLPEVVITVIIISILSTISFITYDSYLVESRDSKRIVDLESISSGLEVYYKKNGGIYPKPADAVVLSYTGSDGVTVKAFSYVGFLKDSVGLDFNGVPRDPLTNDYYAFGSTIDGKFYELGATMENPPVSKTAYVPFVDTAYAAGGGEDYAYTVGNYKMDASKGRFFKSLLVLVKGGDGKYSIPRTDFNVGLQDGITKEVIANADAAFVEYGANFAPYPINSTDTAKSVSEAVSTSSFEIDTATGITLQCRNCQ